MASILNRNGNIQEELLVFGYSCKLFRDDEKALFIENGQHLIPCIADQSLLVDRYDVRGTLYDLQAASVCGPPEKLSEVEQHEEELCEQERYLALYHDLDAIKEQEEEEKKRLHVEIGSANYSQIGYSYSAPVNPPTHETEQPSQASGSPEGYTPQADDDTFVPPSTLCIPPGMAVPETVKHHRVIVKTARFITNQGSQMEIVLKTKQANNVMFGFLSFDNPLNAYYKHLISLMKSGRYKEQEETKAADNNIVDASFNPPQSAPGAQIVKSKPVLQPDCAYSKLISKIRENQAKSGITLLSSESRSQSPIVEAPNVPASLPVDRPTAITSTPVTSSCGKVSSSKPLMGLVDYPSFNKTNDSATSEDSDSTEIVRQSLHGTKKNKLDNFDSIPWPDPKTQISIDKIACYAVKNGSKFEQAIRSRGDARFKFLEDSHKFNSYYQLKCTLYRDIFSPALDKSLSNKKSQSASDMKTIMDGRDSAAVKKCLGRAMQTISFSIRQRKETELTLPPTSFPLESSSSEEDGEEITQEEREKRKLAREERRRWRKMKREQFEKEKKERKEEKERELVELEKRKLKELEEQENGSANEEIYDIFKYAQENGRDLTPVKRVKPKPDSKMRRKKAAHAFLSKLKDGSTEEEPKMIGPQLPPEMMEVMETSLPIPSSPTSPPSLSTTPPPPPPVRSLSPPTPPPPASVTPPPVPSTESAPFTSLLPAVAALKNENRLSKSTLLAEALSSALAHGNCFPN